MIIRAAEEADLDLITELGGLFHAQMIYADAPFDAEHFRQTCKAYIDHPDFTLLIGERSMIAGSLGAHPATGRPMASEIFLYSEGVGQGMRLIKALKGWASENGASHLFLTDQMNMRSLSPLYKRAGAAEIERVYMMEI